MNKDVVYFNIKDTTKLSCHFCCAPFVSCINLSLYLYLAVLGRGVLCNICNTCLLLFKQSHVFEEA